MGNSSRRAAGLQTRRAKKAGSGSAGGTATAKARRSPSPRTSTSTAAPARASRTRDVVSEPANSERAVRQIPTSQIHVGLNPREHFDKEQLDELAASIKAHGLLQPITVRPHEGGYQIIAGERRFRAIQALGQKEVPAIVRHVDDVTARELALIENINRADMRPSETAKAYRGLMEHGASVKQVAERTGKSEGHVQQHLAMLNLAPPLQKAVDEGRLHVGIVGSLSKLSPKGQEEAADRIIGQGLGLRSAKALVQSISARESQTSMFPTERAPTRAQLDAKARYQEAVGRLTETLSRLDEETMAHVASTVESPFREAQRLDLMARQLRRMQQALQVAGHARGTPTAA